MKKFQISERQRKWFRKLAYRWVIVILAFVLYSILLCRGQQAKDLARAETERQQLEETHAAALAAKDVEIAAVKQQAEAGIYATQYLSDDWDKDAWRLGRWLGCLEELYPGLTTEAKQLACWVVFNRVDDDNFPPDVEEVLYQSGQFTEYDDNAELTEENAAIAQNQLSRWKNGDIRPCSSAAVFLSVSNDGVVLRDTYTITATTRYWRA